MCLSVLLRLKRCFDCTLAAPAFSRLMLTTLFRDAFPVLDSDRQAGLAPPHPFAAAPSLRSCAAQPVALVSSHPPSPCFRSSPAVAADSSCREKLHSRLLITAFFATTDVSSDRSDCTQGNAATTAADGEEQVKGHYVNESVASLDLLRCIAAPAPARSLCLLSRVNETFPKSGGNSSGGGKRSLPLDLDRRLDCPVLASEAGDEELLIQDPMTSGETSQEVVKKSEAGMHFYVNGYKVPSSATGLQIKHFL